MNARDVVLIIAILSFSIHNLIISDKNPFIIKVFELDIRMKVKRITQM